MIDIHPPQHGAMTKRDFFVHLFIVVLGILIAIGLEQSVEWMQHRHERDQLEHELVIEAQNNLELMKLDGRYFDQEAPVLTALREEVVSLRTHPASGSHPVDLHTLTGSIDDYFPDAPVWNTAKEGGFVALLPRREAAMYDLVYEQQSLMTEEFHIYDRDRAALADFSLRFATDPSRSFDLAGMSSVNLQEYSALLANLQGDLTRFRRATDIAQAVTLPAARGETNDQQAFEKIGVSKRH